MAKYKNKELDEHTAEELEELDDIAELAIPNLDELLRLRDDANARDITISRRQVYKYASMMSSVNQIATLVGVAKETITKNFKREVKMGHAFGRQKLITRFYKLAVYGDNPADRIFALKNWANMTDKGLVEDLVEIDEGIAFRVSRPAKPIETEYEINTRADGELLTDQDAPNEIRGETLDES